MSAPLWPRVILGGAPKCGTTALHAQLEAAGPLVPLRRKELFVLNDPGFWMPPPDGGFTTHGLACYARLGVEDVGFVDGSTTYLYQRTAVEAAARAHAEGIRFVVVFALRDPVDRLVSNYRYFRHVLQHDVGARSLEEHAQALLRGTLATGNQQVDQALEHGHYARYLRAWYDALPGDRILVLDADQIRADAPGVVDRILGTVGLQRTREAAAKQRAVNQSYRPRWPALQRASRRLGALVPHGALRRAGVGLYHRVFGALAARDAEALSSETRAALAQVLADDVRALRTLVPGADAWRWVRDFPGVAAAS